MGKDESKDAVIDKLKAEITEKDDTLRKVEESIHKLNEKFQTQDNLINSLKDSIKLKDDQIKTIQDSLELKDQQIKTFENSLKTKDEKIATLEKTIELKEEELKAQGSVVTTEKDEKIKNLQKEIDILNDELSKADVDLETLELENEKLRQAQSSSTGLKIIDFTKTEITKSEILQKMREILEKGLHNVMIVVPNIVDLQELYLYEVKSSVNMRISCLINPGIDEHSELLDEFTSLDNITLRSYEREDRYVIVRDGEEMFIAVKGNSENNHLAIHTRDSKHIRLFNSLTMEGWLQSRGI
ncbi:MAG: hypothetical protein ACFE8L_10365 [Candidatus Hodarchaeota archaeon]